MDAEPLLDARDVEVAPPPAPDEATPAPAGWRRHRRAIAAAGLVGGAAVTWMGTTGAVDLPWPRAATVVVGVALLLAGIDSALKLWRGERVQTALWLSVAWLVIVGAAALLADVLPLAEAQDPSRTLTEPSLVRPDLFSEHPLGTDRQSLDILGGVVYGARVSLTVGLGAVAIGLVVGGFLGLLAGYYRGRVDAVIGLVTDALIAFPPLILLLALVSALEPSVRNVTIGLAVLSIPIYVRLARANTLRYAERDFVVMARALGGRDRRILFRELLPNVLPPLVSYGFVVVAVLVVAEASLSYLGLSVQRPNPTWGNLIAAGEDSFDRHPHLVFAPGIVLFLTVFALNRVGEAARVLWDPRARRADGGR
ncbi:MAG TPA: ABC transporter permease [Acidimicrobiales bacterium]